MESYESYEKLDNEGLDLAFENTYKILTGKFNIDNLASQGNEISYILYDPYKIEMNELTDMLNDIIDYFIETEEYEKCQELKNILDSIVLPYQFDAQEMRNNGVNKIQITGDVVDKGADPVLLFKKQHGISKKQTS